MFSNKIINDLITAANFYSGIYTTERLDVTETRDVTKTRDLMETERESISSLLTLTGIITPCFFNFLYTNYNFFD